MHQRLGDETSSPPAKDYEELTRRAQEILTQRALEPFNLERWGSPLSEFLRYPALEATN